MSPEQAVQALERGERIECTAAEWPEVRQAVLSMEDPPLLADSEVERLDWVHSHKEPGA